MSSESITPEEAARADANRTIHFWRTFVRTFRPKRICAS